MVLDHRPRRHRRVAGRRPIPDQCLEPLDLRRAGAEEFGRSFLSSDGVLSARARQHRACGRHRVCPHDHAAALAPLADQFHRRSLAHQRPLLPPQSGVRRSRQSRVPHGRRRSGRDRLADRFRLRNSLCVSFCDNLHRRAVVRGRRDYVLARRLDGHDPRLPRDRGSGLCRIRFSHHGHHW